MFGAGGFGGILSLLGGLFGGRRQTGGPVREGQVYEVGERGREWFVPNRSGNIIPNSQAGAGGTTNNFYFQGMDIRGEIRSQILEMLPTMSSELAQYNQYQRV